MKKNGYFLLFICIFTVIITEFSICLFMLKKNRLFPKTEIVLKIENDSIGDNELPLVISKESIENLQEAIAEVSLNNNLDILLENFEKERNFYINFITIISIVLSVVGIAPAIYGIFEKNENEKLREDLENLKKEYDLRLNKIKMNAIFDWFSDKTKALKEDYSLLFDDSSPVENEHDFYKFIIANFIKTTNEIEIDLLDERQMQYFAIKLSNFMGAIISYTKKRYSKSFNKDFAGKKYLIQGNEIFNNMFIQLQTLLSEDQFNNLISVMLSFPNSIFDFTGFITNC